MGAHALGAAAYAAKAASLAGPNGESNEIAWQLAHMSAAVRTALRALPPLGEDRSGPLGPGLLATGQVGAIIRQLQAAIGTR